MNRMLLLDAFMLTCTVIQIIYYFAMAMIVCTRM
jgi:hypothetical protein